MKIAIVEADGAIQHFLREAGNRPGDQILNLTGSGDDLRRQLDDADPRVLILDWAWHRAVGAELCKQIRQRGPAEPYVYAIAVVESEHHPGQLEAFQAGVDAVLARPFDGNEILARLDVARRISSHEQSLRSRSDELERIRLDLESTNATLSEIASSDVLTGLRNRRYFGEALDSQFSLSRRKGLPISLVMIDVDQFKDFNDRFGHPAGDEVLREVGAILRACVRDHDIVARYGGEEFAVLLPATEESECLPIVDRLRATVAHHLWPLRPITISLGAATLTSSDSHPSELVDQADRALYYSKALGRNQATHSRALPDLATNPIHDRMAAGSVLSGFIVGP